MKLRSLIALTTCTFTVIALQSCVKAQVPIASDSKSTFTIVIPAQAPATVKNAANELQTDIAFSTGAKLSVQTDTAKISAPFISLGNTTQAKAADINSEKMADESFRIVTKSGNVFIIGPDTPDGGWTTKNGASNGTANGVYTFLEDYLDVRWLMPGDIGRDIPKKSTFTLEDIDRTVTPMFAGLRTLSHLRYFLKWSQKNNASTWEKHLKLGGTTNYDFNHNQWRGLNNVLTPGISYAASKSPNTEAIQKLYKEHPEWFAMNKAGNRPFPHGRSAKLETTNQEFIQWYTDHIVTQLKSRKRPSAFSLSPSDGRNFSRSPESVALYDPISSYDPITQRRKEQDLPVVSSLIATWYRDVSKAVAEKYPEGRLAGFLYQDYSYPPTKIDTKLPENFTPWIAPSPVYGYGLYREDTQKYFHDVMDEWAKSISGDWYYYDLPSQLYGRGEFAGLITPVAADNLNIIFRQLVKSHVNGATIYGNPSGSNGAVSNYILAKMQWDPTLDAHKLQHEWLTRAYGPDAGKVMETFYAKLDDWFRSYFQQSDQSGYKFTLQLFKEVYGVHYPEMEKLFLQAKSQQMTDVQRERLQLIEDNFILLQWRLRNVGYLPESYSSPLRRTDAQISDLMTAGDKRPDFSLFPGATNAGAWTERFFKPQPLPWKVVATKQPVEESKSTLPKWNESQILIHAAKDGDIIISTQNIVTNAYFAAYEVKNQKGVIITTGIFNTEKPLVISAKAGESYTLNMPLLDSVNFQLQVQNAAIATGNLQNKELQLSGKDSPVYVFYVGGKSFMSVSEKNGSVIIKKPDSSLIAQRYASSQFSKARLTGFDSDWLFHPDPQNDGIKRGVLKADFDDSLWSEISPYQQWQLQQPMEDEYHGHAWYRLKFDAPKLDTGENAQIYFGAVDGNAEVYLNGKKIQEHRLGKDGRGWDRPFAADATASIKAGQNILAVKVTSKPTGGSGITGGVALIIGTK